MLVEAGFSDIRFRRRGRGASYILRASRELAQQEKIDIPALSTSYVDLRAAVMATAAEELVVTARK